MPSLTPRATVVRALAIREAELLDQAPASGHVLVALIWEGGGVAATALAGAGLPKGADHEVRERLAGAADLDLGMGADALLGAAGKIACDFGRDYLGTEHQLLAIVADSSLGAVILPPDVRNRAAVAVRSALAKRASET